MNVRRQWVIRMMMFCFLSGVQLIAAGIGESINIWSGRKVAWPESGVWRLVAEHGRLLVSGNGGVRMFLPELTAGTTLDAILEVNGKNRKIRIHSLKPFSDLGKLGYGDCEKFKKLARYGLTIFSENIIGYDGAKFRLCSQIPQKLSDDMTLVFPGSGRFPLNLGRDWEKISLNTAKIPGYLSVLLDHKERIANWNGLGTYIRLQRGRRLVYIFTPQFDFDRLENILLLKKQLENKR